MKPILIIEDDEDIRTLLIDFLESLGFSIESARDGKEGLMLLKRDSPLPGVILLDMMMPVMDGPTFQSEVAHDPSLSGIPIIVMTADPLLLQTALDRGAQAGVKKPMDLDELMKTLQKFPL